MEIPYCEQCGEAATTTFQYTVLCDDCARLTADAHISFALLPYRICGNLLYNADGSLKAICVVPYGVEHEHE